MNIIQLSSQPTHPHPPARLEPKHRAHSSITQLSHLPSPTKQIPRFQYNPILDYQTQYLDYNHLPLLHSQEVFNDQRPPTFEVRPSVRISDALLAFLQL